MDRHRSAAVRYEVDGQKCYITLDRPEALNAFNDNLRAQLVAAVSEFSDDHGLRVAILSGAGGKAFCVGADLKEMAKLRGVDSSGVVPVPGPPRPGNLHVFDALAYCRKPVIAAVDGWCLAGGFEIALMCDMRVATRHSQFGLPEPRRGLLAAPGLIHLSRMVPLGEALRMQLTGAPCDALRAYAIGLIQEIAEDREELFSKVETIADQIIECSPNAVEFIKRIVKAGRELPVEQHWDYAASYYVEMASSLDVQEGLRAFSEKRPPDWSGCLGGGRP